MIICININVNGKMGNEFPVIITADCDCSPLDALKKSADIKKFLESKIKTLTDWLKTVFYIRSVDSLGEAEDRIYSMHEVYDLDLKRVRGVIDHICKEDEVIGIDELDQITIPKDISTGTTLKINNACKKLNVEKLYPEFWNTLQERLP